MAISKVTIDALSQMANFLRQSAEEIMSAKGEMDGQLRSFIWDDQTGYAFSVKYEEDFKPLTQKLIPAINNFVNYLINLGCDVADYGGVLGAFGLGGALGADSLREAKGKSQKDSLTNKTNKANRNQEINKKMGKNVLSHSSDPANVGLSQEDFKMIKDNKEYNDKYEERRTKYLNALNTLRPNLKEEIKSSDIDEINSTVFNLKPEELKVEFKKLGEKKTLGGREIKENAYINNDFLHAHPGWTHCGAGGIGAHESTHALQYKIFKRLKKEIQENPKINLSDAEKSILENFPKQYESWSEDYYHDPMEIDARISHYAWIDACNHYVIETYIKNKK